MNDAFEQALLTRERPGFTVTPASITWSAIAFDVHGAREAVACVPRESLSSFLTALEDGSLDEEIRTFLDAPPTGRVLKNAGQTRRPALFDELGAPGAIAPRERVPGRNLPLGGAGGGTPVESRRNKGRRQPGKSSRTLIAAGAAALVVAGVVAALALGGGDDDKVTATGGGPTPTTTGLVNGKAPPPDPATLPPGAELVVGDSGGDNIGFIAQDGLSRFLSLTGPGVVKGDAAGRDIAITWDRGAGHVISFGANFHTTNQPGQYGVNVFRNVSASGATTGATADLYKHGCAILVGQTACRADNVGSLIENGDKISIIIGESGHLDARGEFSVDWWFVFQPD